MIELFYGLGRGAGVDVLEPYASTGCPVFSELRTKDYITEASWDILGPGSDENLAGHYYPTSALLGALPDDSCSLLATAIATMPDGCSIIFNQLGGKAADVPKTDTAVYHRDAKYWLIINAAWGKSDLFATRTEKRDKAVNWAKTLRSDLMPYSIGRYGNLSQDTADEWNDAVGKDPLAMASWGANYAKLRDVKKKYDPKNLFSINHNILPAP